MSNNQVYLIGNLGMDPEIIETSNNTKLAKTSMATSIYFKDKNGEEQNKTEWHKIIAWGNNADFLEKYFKKGTRLMVIGMIVNRTYTNKAGETQYITEVKAEKIYPIATLSKAA